MNQKSYDQIVEAVRYYTVTKKYEELRAIITLLEKNGFSQDIVHHLLGDVHFIFQHHKQVISEYTKTANIYHQSGEQEKEMGLKNTIENLKNFM